MKHQLVAAAIAAATIAVALASGGYRRAALIGAATSGLTAIGSILAIGRVARTAVKPVKGALVVMTVAFLVRIVLVAVGTVLVSRAGENVFAFVIAFFVPYFVYSAVEGAYVHSLSRETGPTA